jgi:hypothetical protein
VNSSVFLVGMLAVGVILCALAIWVGPKEFHAAPFALAVLVVLTCVLLAAYGLFLGAPLTVRPRYPTERLFELLVVPAFVLLPAAVGYCVSQVFARRASSLPRSRALSAAAALASILVVPLGAIVAGCGLAGVCF